MTDFETPKNWSGASYERQTYIRGGWDLNPWLSIELWKLLMKPYIITCGSGRTCWQVVLMWQYKTASVNAPWHIFHLGVLWYSFTVISHITCAGVWWLFPVRFLMDSTIASFPYTSFLYMLINSEVRTYLPIYVLHLRHACVLYITV